MTGNQRLRNETGGMLGNVAMEPAAMPTAEFGNERIHRPYSAQNKGATKFACIAMSSDADFELCAGLHRSPLKV